MEVGWHHEAPQDYRSHGTAYGIQHVPVYIHTVLNTFTLMHTTYPRAQGHAALNHTHTHTHARTHTHTHARTRTHTYNKNT